MCGCQVTINTCMLRWLLHRHGSLVNSKHMNSINWKDKIRKEKKMVKMKKMIIAVMIVVVMVSSQMDTVYPSAADCYDACSTACVQPDTRLMQRCDRKCQIKCDPAASQVQEEHLV